VALHYDVQCEGDIQACRVEEDGAAIITATTPDHMCWW